MYDNTIIVYYAILTMILLDTINHENITYVIQSNLVIVSTPGDPPNCCSLSVVLANHID